MGNGLRDQLLKAGLVNDKQVKKAVKDKQKEIRQQQGQGKPSRDEQALLERQKAQAEKAERDRQLNLQRKENAEQKALGAQVRQLIETHRQTKGEGDTAYNFTDGNMVKRLYISDQVREKIAKGNLAIVRLDSQYELVPADVAEKIRERDSGSVVLWHVPTSENASNSAADPYAQYEVPDDLIW